ncbi:MAG: DNA mismatch repair endonuclease MutL [Bacteroidia bacterium]|nr:DNA mismatch repair endonuclease MutL [Bacteroidia bacterium]NNF30137.1 DNA mismatch repair endonuclease MutL [Flavobacteriaceae bacterium]MBT8275015.1 DNA mismatch repair endonuclease MutL [Bacteroidia bacterium]NNJ81803.1 DNA mismatch repair endonuclease MutL [Flavobacteriaceae bacterium]NNK55499.1 DNA mismatch repair endonuclease MutL [Flavobacteriaceae bacterium]
MPDIIQLLPDHVANQIAAGEVVQRPASVVKELLENAIDAGATKISVVVKDAGKTLVQVTDNGVGMSTTDARLSFERHATSKIKTAEDLFNLHTKGFRGEALASIAAIAHVELKTKTEEAEIGTKICIEGSTVVSQEAEVVPQGTTIAVKNLFYNIPARRNFLKSNPVETRHIIDEFHRVALAHPQVAFSMVHNGSDVFNLPPSNIRQRIVNIFGSKTNQKLVPVTEETEIVKVNGFVLKPEFARKSRGEQFFFVNDRFIKSPYLHHAVSSAFEGLIRDRMHPGYFLFLEVKPTTIDINIHPTKTEIKFDDEHSIYAMLRSTIKHGLGQFSVAPVLDFNKDSSFDTPYEYSKKSPVLPTIEVDRDFNPFKEGGAKSGGGFTKYKDKSTNWESLYVGLKGELSGSTDETDVTQIEFESEEVTGRLFDTNETDSGQLTFQLQQKYIISPIKSGLMVIHQHLAHQRILYEELLRNMTVKEAVSQQLLFPMEIELSKPDMEILQKVREQLEHTGFHFESFSEEKISISGIPVGLNDSSAGKVLDQLITDIRDEVPDASFSLNDLLAKSMAKSMAVRTGTALNKAEREHLVNRLFACKEPSVSPDNTQVLITLDVTELDKRFM